MMMLLTSVSAALFLLATTAEGFSPLHGMPTKPTNRLVLSALSPEEIAERARANIQKVEEEEEAPKIFEDDILNDMQQSLLTLEKRVKEGPGSLSMLEVEELDAMLQRILDEMVANEHKRIEKPVRPSEETAEAPAGPQAAAQAAPPVAPQSVQQQQPITDTSLDEGPAYTGGMGQAKGTANTYIIEGMEEMSPEEYRKKLQESVIERQRERRRSKKVGNRASWDYLNAISGEEAIFKFDDDVEDGL